MKNELPHPIAGESAGSVMCLRAWVALGSNLGDRAATIRAALDRIAALPDVRVIARSSLRETEPVGGPPGQGRYLNAAAEIEMAAEPGSSGARADAEMRARAARRLLDQLFEIERALGRVRNPRERNAPRTIDLDLLLVEIAVSTSASAATPLILRQADLELPHPRLHERRFVLAPLVEIAPDVRHPTLGLTIAELLARLPDRPAGFTPARP